VSALGPQSPPHERRFIDHVSIGVTELERSARFYDAVLGDALGADRIDFAGYGIGYGYGNPSVWLTPAESPPGSGHIAFRVADRETVRRFHAAGLDAGGADEGPPGPRPQYGTRYYAAYLRDPDGTKVEAVVARPMGDP
jgi:catechol 2,3-dioxygenase-like lactoylglutathione lyase family enzyme